MSDIDIRLQIKIVFNNPMLENTINKNTVKLLNKAESTEVGGTKVLFGSLSQGQENCPHYSPSI